MEKKYFFEFARLDICDLPVWSGNEAVQGRVFGSCPAADVFLCAECTSSFDVAWFMAQNYDFAWWDSVLALTQTAGRGQMRRGWFSPPCNLHVAFRLPDAGFFKSAAASVLTALLFIKAFESFGLRLKLKWPNDLVLDNGVIYGKLGGILLEERSGVSLAGVGINRCKVPESDLLREGSALRPVMLPAGFAGSSPLDLWIKLVPCLNLIYGKIFVESTEALLLSEAERYLLWRGMRVQVFDSNGDNSPVSGYLSGLTAKGGLRLFPLSSSSSLGKREMEIYSGSVSI